MRNRSLLLICALALSSTPAAAQQREMRIERMPLVMHFGAANGWLGFSFSVEARNMNGERRESVVVGQVQDGSPAQKAGVMPGDTLVRLNGLTANEELIRSLSTFLEPGDTVRLQVKRAAARRDFTLVAAERPANMRVAAPGRRIILDGDSIRDKVRVFLDSARVRLDSLRLPRIRIESGEDDSGPGFAYSFSLGERGVAGAELTQLNAELGEYFGSKEGLLVLRVGEGTPAARAGIEAGDVILRADGSPVANVVALRRAFFQADGETVKLELVRKKQKVTVNVQRESDRPVRRGPGA